ncbi:MAG: hypothetical protein QOF58_3040 [Pseudonocardiales bacterium]|nr:hypothetical protein [Pseudonocardiales bacterium]
MPRQHRTSTDPPSARPLFRTLEPAWFGPRQPEPGRVSYASAMPATTELRAARRAGSAAAITAAITARPSMTPI